MTPTRERSGVTRPLERDGTVVDADVHVRPDDESALRERLPDRFRGKGVSTPSGNWANPLRTEGGIDPDHRRVATDPDRFREKYLDRYDVDHAVVVGGPIARRASVAPDASYGTAVTSAYNDWLLERWIETDDRLHGSISVAAAAPERAAEEIRRLGDHPSMVQVALGGASHVPLGRPDFWPIYEAAEAEDLPVALHAGPEGYGIANPNTGAGYAGSYVERQAGLPSNAMSQLLNLLLEGVFVEHQGLELVMAEWGFGWVPPFLWRLDKYWRGLSDEAPWLDRLPSEYVRDHVYFTTHPVERPEQSEYLRTVIDQVHGDETLLFSSGFPRWDADVPSSALPELEGELANAVFAENALSLYGLEPAGSNT